jgi:glycosyltransferase involved in cell wall biosynthesis
LTIRGKWGEIFRDFMNGTLRAISGARLARHATLLVALNPDVQARWQAGPTPVVMASNIALDKTELAVGAPTATGRGDQGPRLALFVGRLIPWKGLLLAVQSLRHAPHWKLVVLGEGPDRARAEALAIRLGVEDRLEFRGLVPRPEVLDIFRCADAVLFPSFHDSASWAVGEASSLGCPVVCLDVGGPAIQAGRNAYVVPVTPGATLPERLGARLEGLTGRGEPHDDLRSDRISGVLRTWYAGTVSRSDRSGADRSGADSSGANGSGADGARADGAGADGAGADGSGARRAGRRLDSWES